MITDLMKTAHHEGDAWLERAENRLAAGDWANARAALHGFADSLHAHFNAEESLLFPALQEVMGAGFPPVQVMRQEHARLRALLEELVQLADEEDQDAFLAQADAVRVMLLQHNLKEESILYPLADRTLASRLPALLDALQLHAPEQVRI